MDKINEIRSLLDQIENDADNTCRCCSDDSERIDGILLTDAIDRIQDNYTKLVEEVTESRKLIDSAKLPIPFLLREARRDVNIAGALNIRRTLA